MRAFLCLAALPSCLIASHAEELKEITVTAKQIVNKADGQTYLPSSTIKKLAHDGLELLRLIQLPGISVNPLTGAVNLPAGGSVALRINGVAATSAELAALVPDDILRIEYHDNPGMRYDEGDVVLDIITRRNDSGGLIALESMNAVGDGKWASMDNLSARYSHGESTFSASANYFGMERNSWIRDYEELWRYPDGDVNRREEGLPVKASLGGLFSNIGYSLAKGRSVTDITLHYAYNYVPAKEEGDRRAILTTSASDKAYLINEHTSERSSSPSADINYRLRISDSQKLSASLSGIFLRSHSTHYYSETDIADAALPVEICTDVKGRKWAMKAEAVYDIDLWKSHVTAGLRHRQSYISNNYVPDGTTSLRQNESSVFGEYRVNVGMMNFMGAVSGKRLYRRQTGSSPYTSYSLNPQAGIGINLPAGINLRYNFRMEQLDPSPSLLADIEQQVQPGMVTRGNPEAKAYYETDQNFTATYAHKIFNIYLSAGYRNEKNPVMSTTFFDGSQFVKTYMNQRSFSELSGMMSVSVRPWGNHLSLSVTPSLHRYFSRGLTYSHTRNIARVAFAVDFNYGHFTFSASSFSGPANTMYGEEIITEKDMNMILAGYKGSFGSVEAGVFNAFMKRYEMKTRNLSALTPYTSVGHCSRNCYATVRLSLTLNFGRKKIDIDFEETPYQADSDSGILDNLK